MTVTAINAGQDQVFGLLSLDSSSFNSGVLYHWNWLDGFRTDIEPYQPAPSQAYTWRIQWYLSLSASQILNSASLFKSALPKYDLGVVNYAYRGQSTYGQYWNYSAQRFAPAVCWLVDADISYPTPQVAPPLLDSANLRWLSLDVASEFTMFASDVFIKPLSADVASMQAALYYQAFIAYDDLPISWGFI